MAGTTREKANNGDTLDGAGVPTVFNPPPLVPRFSILVTSFFVLDFTPVCVPSPVVNFVVSVAIDTISRKRDREMQNFIAIFIPAIGSLGFVLFRQRRLS